MSATFVLASSALVAPTAVAAAAKLGLSLSSRLLISAAESTSKLLRNEIKHADARKVLFDLDLDARCLTLAQLVVRVHARNDASPQAPELEHVVCNNVTECLKDVQTLLERLHVAVAEHEARYWSAYRSTVEVDELLIRLQAVSAILDRRLDLLYKCLPLL